MPNAHTRRGNHEGSIVKRSDGRFQASIMFEGKRVYYYNSKRTACTDWLTDMRTKIRRGIPVSDSTVTLGAWIEHYIETYCVGFVRPSTLANYRGYADKHILPDKIANIKISQLNTDQIQVFMNGLKRTDNAGELSAHTKRNIWLFLNGALGAAETSGLILRNPAKGVKLRKVTKAERPYLTDQDVTRLIETAAGHPWQLGIVILAHGLRISEMLALRQSSIVEIDGIKCFNVKQAVKREYINGSHRNKTTVRLSEPKTSSSTRYVPIMQSALELVKSHINYQIEQASRSFGCYEPDPFLVGKEALGAMVSPDRFRSWFRQCVERAGLSPDITPHALRHYAARTMVRSCSPAAAAKVLGHASPTTTLTHYTHENLKEAAMAVQTIPLLK